MKSTAIDRYLARMAAYARSCTRHATLEAEYYAETGDHQLLVTIGHLCDDDATTTQRLRRYQTYLGEARRAGQYLGGTRLRRVLPDGNTEPWESPEATRTGGRARLVRRLWLRLGGQED